MQLEQYVAQVQAQLTAAAAVGDDRTRATADALATAAGPAVRLALLGAVAAAADEITSVLLDSTGAPAVSVRLDGDELRVEVRPTAPIETEVPGNAGTDETENPENTARISLRLPESLKSQVEGAARAGGVSVNSWIVRAVAGAVAGSRPGGRWSSAWDAAPHRLTGWING